MDYLSRFWRCHAWVPQASLQADSALTRHQEQKPQDPRRTRWLQVDMEQSAPTHARHTHCTPMQLGTTADRSMTFLWTDFVKHAIWQRVRWEARCKGFCSKVGLHFWLEQSVRNQLERNQVQRVLEKPSGSYLLTSNNQPISLVWKSLCDSSPGLYCVDFAETYVTQENVSLRNFTRKGMICIQSNGHLHEKPLQRKAERGKNAGTYLGTRLPGASYIEKTHYVFQKHGGACTTWYLEYKRYEMG